LTATALEDFAHEGDVWVHSERWRARSSTPIKKGQMLRITRVDGLTLEVTPLANDNNDKER
jgi:membrane-bound serine protease (ClpP class)